MKKKRYAVKADYDDDEFYYSRGKSKDYPYIISEHCRLSFESRKEAEDFAKEIQKHVFGEKCKIVEV